MIFIDYNDKRPIYEQVTEKIQTLILNGVLEPDSKLPSVRSLAMELSINPNTCLLYTSSHDKETGGRAIMTKGRKTTFEERVEIVQYCIKHSHNYSETAKKFHISYQQARSYTIRYEENGVDGLQDKRG